VDLAQVFEDIFAPYTPWEIFLRILHQLYGNEVAELEKEDKGLDAQQLFSTIPAPAGTRS
jgi:hypothetical protein